jgi:hypothetical protein
MRQQPLARFLLSPEAKTARITISRLSRKSGYSRDHLTNVREGRAFPSLECIKAVTHAASELAHRQVTVDELFDLRPARRRAS